MRKSSRLSGLFLCILTLCVCSCGGGGSAADPMGTGTVTLTADATAVQPGGFCTLTATVTNNAVPVIGERIYFSLLTANGGTLLVVSDRTGSGGVATAIYTAGNNMASDTVRVRTDVGATASITITKTGGIVGARISSLEALPTTVAADQTSVIMATVTDGNSNPMQYETVTFTLPVNKSGASFVNAAGVHVSSVSVNTDANGKAVAMYQAGSTSLGAEVQDTVQAVLTNGSSNLVVITRSAGTDLSVSVAASTTSVNAGQTSTITATVTGDKKSGAAVTFTLPVNASGASFINAGGSPVSSITLTASGSGIATAIYRAGSTSSDTTVQDTVQVVLTNGANGAVILTRMATIPTTYAVSIDASTISVTAGQFSVITATVTSGTTAPPATPVAGITLTFTLPVNNSGATLSASSAVTDGNGKAVVTYTAGSNSPTLTVYDTVKAAFGSVSSTAVITRTGTTYTVLISAPTTPVTAGQASIITATVTSTSGSTSTPAGGVAVTFTLPVNNSGAALSASSAVTDGNGKAVVTYTAGAATPTLTVYDTVKAAVGSVSSTAVITRTGTSTAVSIDASTTSVTAGQVSIITATVTNTSGSTSTPASGVTVTFTLPVNGSGATLSSSTATTDGSGKAVVTYKAGSNSPTLSVQDTVQAAVGTATNALVITRTGTGITAYAVLIGAAPTSVTAGQVSVITATVTSGSLPASGVTVAFTLPVNSSGATLSAATATTDGSGKAVVTYQPGILTPTLTVQDTVQAAVGTATNTVVITRTGTGITVYAVLIGAAPTSVTAGQVSIITATVTSGSIPASGVTVTFTLPVAFNNSGATLSSSTAVTDGAGKAVVTYQPGILTPTLTVQDTVQAAVGTATNTVVITRTGTGITAYAVLIDAAPTSVTAGQVSIITATVTSGSIPASGVTVTFTLPVAFNNSGATLSSSTAVTDGAGNAVVVYQPGITSPTLTVQDTVQAEIGTAANTVVITRTGSATSAYSITVGPPVPATVPIAGGSSVITANVKTNAGTPISGVTVNFTTIGGTLTGGGVTASATTDGSGNAVTVFTVGPGGPVGTTAGIVTASITIAGNPYTDAVVITY